MYKHYTVVLFMFIKDTKHLNEEHARVQHDRTCLLSGALSPFIFLTSPGIFDRQVI